MENLKIAENTVAMVAHQAERIWEALAVLEEDNADGVAVRVFFPFDCEVVGLYASVSISGVAGGAMPDLDDILVSLQVNQDTGLTARFAEQDEATQEREVTLGVYRDTLQGPRTTKILMTQKALGQARNSILVRFSWKDAAYANANFSDTNVGLAFLVRKVRS